MKIILLFIGISILSLTTSNLLAQNFVWANQSTSTSANNMGGLEADANGNTYVNGSFYGIYTIGDTIFSETGFLVTGMFAYKLNADGNVLWAKHFGETTDYDVIANDVAINADGKIFMAGIFAGTAYFDDFTLISQGNFDVFIIEIDPTSGHVIHAISFGGAGIEDPVNLSADNFGNIYLAATFSDEINYEAYTITPLGAGDIYLAKFNSALAIQWLTSAGGAGNQILTYLNNTRLGDPVITGYFVGVATFGDITVDGGTENYGNFFIARYSAITGNCLWVKTGVAADGHFASGGNIAVAYNRIYCTGSTDGTVNFDATELTFADGYQNSFMATFDDFGNLLWTKKFETSDYIVGGSMTTDKYNHVYYSSAFTTSATYDTLAVETTPGNASGIIIKYDTSGVLNTYKILEGNDYYFTGIMDVDSLDNVYVNGSYLGTTLLDTIALSSIYNPVFVAKISADDFIPQDTVGQDTTVVDTLNYIDINQFVFDVHIYPNPVSDILHATLQIQYAIHGYLQIFSTDNTLIYERPIQVNAGKNDITCAISHLPAGLYILQLNTDAFTSRYSFIKM